MGFSRQYWNGSPFPSPGDLFRPGIKPRSPALKADSLLSEPSGPQPNLLQHYQNLTDLGGGKYPAPAYYRHSVLSKETTTEKLLRSSQSRGTGSLKAET